MSLISDALKKAQQEREKIQDDNDSSIELEKINKGPGINKRVWYYGIMALMVLLILTLFIIYTNRQKETMMQALNVDQARPKAAPVKEKKQEPQPPPVETKTETPLIITTQPEPGPVKEKIENETPFSAIKSVELVEDTPEHLKFEVALSGAVEYTIVPVTETPGRLAIDLKNARSEPIEKPIHRLNVKRVRGGYNTSSVFRLVFVLNYLKDYKVYAKDKRLFVEFTGLLEGKEESDPKIETKIETKVETKVEKKVEPKEKPLKAKKIEKIKEPPKSKDDTAYEGNLSEGDRLLEAQDYLEAAEKYKNALKIRKTPELYQKIYTAYKGNNNDVLARAYVEEGLKNFPDDLTLNKIVVVLNIRDKDYPKAMENAKKAIEKNSGDHNLYTYLGLSYFHTKDYPKALANFQKSLDLDSDAAENYYYIGLIFDNKADYKRALEYYNAFIKVNRDDKNFKHKAWIVQRMKELQEYQTQNEKQQ